MLNKMSFKMQLLSGYFLILGVLTIISIVAYHNITNLITISGWVSHTYEVIGEGRSLVEEMVNQETGMRGYLVAGKDHFLEPYTQEKANFRKIMDELQKTVSDNPPQVARLQEIDQSAQNWLKNAADVQIQKRRKDRIIERMAHESSGHRNLSFSSKRQRKGT